MYLMYGTSSLLRCISSFCSSLLSESAAVPSSIPAFCMIGSQTSAACSASPRSNSSSPGVAGSLALAEWRGRASHWLSRELASTRLRPSRTIPVAASSRSYRCAEWPRCRQCWLARYGGKLRWQGCQITGFPGCLVGQLDLLKLQIGFG